MKNIFILGFVSVAILSCSRKYQNLTTYEGDLAIKLIALGSSYLVINEHGDTTANLLDAIDPSDGIDKGEEIIINHFKILKEHDLIDLPMIDINFDPNSNSMYSVFFSPEEYEKIKDFHHFTLEKEGMKLRLKFTGTEVSKGKIKAHKILSVKKIPGRTIILK
ncbi:MAG: hypothetical protein AAF573_21490 [Bacteroidota bacterium]